jgi:cellulose synthase/poly-beta-1,6-N-acetylglucosamine synthase-like glycosyltransferase
MSMAVLGWLSVAVLGVFAVRRLTALASAFGAIPERAGAGEVPAVVVLAPMRNEEGRCGALLEALTRLEYPGERLEVVLGDDASTDGTAAMLAAWAKDRGNAHVVTNREQGGKAALLNRMLGAGPGAGAPLVAVYDAKHSPAPDSLGKLAAAMADGRLGCARGYLEPRNGRASVVARYAALEYWVTQLVDHAGRERRGRSSPPAGGNSVYRRAALEEVGGFRAGAYSEDTEQFLALTGAGWECRYVPAARASTTVAESLSAFWNQRLRWNRGLYAAAGRHRGPRRFSALGYLDRLALLAAVGFAVGGWVPIWAPAAYVALPVLMVGAALVKAGAVREAPAFLCAAVLMFPVDLAVTIWGSLLAVTRRGPRWR